MSDERPKLPGVEVIVMSAAPATPDVLGAVPVPPGYTNHVGSGRDTAGNIFWAVTVDGPNSGDVDVAILRRNVSTAAWIEIWRFDERTYGKHGYGTLQPLPDGSLSCGLAERNASGQTVATERIVPAEYAQAVWAGGGGGDFTAPQGGFVRIKSVTLNDPPFVGEAAIDLAAFDAIPAGMRTFKLKICISAVTVGARFRIGPNTDGDGASMLTVATQVIGGASGIGRIYAEGERSSTSEQTIYIWADNGPLRECFVDIVGMK